jgi:hypothetical protein
MTSNITPVDVFRLFKRVREVAGRQNEGQRVEAIQTWCGGKKGDSYCCYLATMVLDLFFAYFDKDSPIPREGSCQAVYELAKKNGWVTTTPSVGDLFLYVDENGHAHHIGMVTNIPYTRDPRGALVGIAGNTSPDGKSSNGTGVFEHEISAKVFIHYPR